MFKSLRAGVKLAETTASYSSSKVSQSVRTFITSSVSSPFCQQSRRLFSRQALSNSRFLTVSDQCKLKCLQVQHRSYASSPADDIDFEKIERPRANDPFKWISTRIQIAFHMFILDKQFSYKEFSNGALQAVLLVSELIAKGRVSELESLLHPKIFQSVKKSIEMRKDRKETLNLIQNRTDISQQVPAGIHVRKIGDRTIVDIECMFYILPNAQQMFQEMFSQNKTGYKDIGQLVTEKAQVAHYIFRREYGPSETNSNWIIIYLKHHAVKDLE